MTDPALVGIDVAPCVACQVVHGAGRVERDARLGDALVFLQEFLKRNKRALLIGKPSLVAASERDSLLNALAHASMAEKQHVLPPT